MSPRRTLTPFVGYAGAMHILARFSKAIAALVPPTLGLMVAFGFDLTEDQRQAIMAVVAVVTPLVVAGAPANRDPADDISWHFNENGEPVRD